MHPLSGKILDGDVAIVTGGTSGIGEAIVRTLAGAGAAVAIADIYAERAESLAQSLGERTMAIKANVSAPSDVDRMVQATVERFGKSTILIHSAAPQPRSGALLEMPADNWEKVVSVILMGGYYAARAFAEQVIRQGSGGRIVNIISTVVERPRVNSSAYCSAKSGLTGLTKVLALELAEYGITANAVGPGLTLTPTVAERNTDSYNAAFLKQVPRGRLGESQDIANAVLFMVSPAAEYITGQTIYVDGGYTAGNLSVQG